LGLRAKESLLVIRNRGFTRTGVCHDENTETPNLDIDSGKGHSLCRGRKRSQKDLWIGSWFDSDSRGNLKSRLGSAERGFVIDPVSG